MSYCNLKAVGFFDTADELYDHISEYMDLDRSQVDGRELEITLDGDVIKENYQHPNTSPIELKADQTITEYIINYQY